MISGFARIAETKGYYEAAKGILFENRRLGLSTLKKNYPSIALKTAVKA